MRRVESIALRVRVENAHQRLSWGALGSELEMVECHAGEQARCPFGQILLADTPEVRSGKTLLQLRQAAATSTTAGALVSLGDGVGDSLDQGDARSRNATQETVVIGSYLRVHTQLSFSRSRRTAARNLAASPPVTQR